MSLTIDCGEGKHEPVCRGAGDRPYLFPQLAGEAFTCACPCHCEVQDRLGGSDE